ncbi:phospho-acceptor domain-containing protein [Desulfobotulus alkaliphilus]|uniref:histidine kinase n=1 Tax=Desulfobotulus alkaliphilus TaxID=622671 RepID=A0A562S018_9BACT|nr:ATP-binding protein [Desulfobotulus alkaliphilus]TWI74144.1 phospho-acceptor domain-containing protein [Desulfobotulus alkaliphilus]
MDSPVSGTSDKDGILSLRSRLYLSLGGILLLMSAGTGIMAWYTRTLENLVNEDIPRSIAAFQSAEALETAMINQKGFVTYYMQDRDPEWLRRLGEYRRIFREKLEDAKSRARTPAQKDLIREIDKNYQRYILMKDGVIDHYVSGRFQEGQEQHPEIRMLFFRIIQLCEDFKTLQAHALSDLQENVRKETRQVRNLTLFILLITSALVFVLGMEISRQILRPLRKLAQATGAMNFQKGNEVNAVSRGVQGLIRDAGEASRRLERSRENLEQAERMVMVARLAAGMAHSIRNPLTSVKMRLFSLSRSLKLDEDQREDFDVISSEINHIDTIVQHFLEFSRPPKLKIQSICPSDVVDQALTLLKHRLASYDVTVTLNRKEELPQIAGDPEQLKEVLVNLIENSCQAMEGRPGHMEISEGLENQEKPMARIRIHDSGPGIPADLLPRIFDPFVTTKEDGTGLGLSIANRIIENHGGSIEVRSVPGNGTTFDILLPCTDRKKGEA